MKKLKILSVLMVLCIMLGVTAPSAYAIEDPPELKSAAIYLADIDTGYVYFERQAHNQVYPASLTKIMTALLIIEAVERGDLTLEEKVTAQPGFDFDMVDGGSSAQIVEGEILSVRDLLYCTLLASANEATNIIAAHMYGTIDGFVVKMNERAAQLGCTGTNFMNPHGLPNDNHYTTAYDMFLIAQEAMKHELFVTICDSIEATVEETNKSGPRGLTNTNGLITSASDYKGYYYEPAIGIKTGTTEAAGFCLASSAKSRSIHPICIIMGGVMTEYVNGKLDYSNYSDSISLYNWVFSNYTRMELVEGETIILDVPVKLGSNADSISLRAEETVTGVLPNDVDMSQLQQNITIYSDEEDLAVKAPFDEGTVLGEISVSMNGVEYGKTYLVANRSVDLSVMSAMFDSFFNTLSNPIVRTILVLAVLAAIAYGMLIARYRMNMLRQQRELEEARIQRIKLEEQAKRSEMMADARQRSYHSYSTPAHNKYAEPNSNVENRTRDFFDEFFPD